MPGPDDTTSPVDAPKSLLVAPFRGVRYVADRVSDLAAVTSPPYDAIDPDDATHLEQLDPHNVVRLILPRDPSGGGPAGEGPGRYAHAAELLTQWRAEGVLSRDPEPALYVYEQSGPGLLQRGLVAAVGLRDPADRVVLPHEDVMAGPVADRLELMRATGAHLEPILLVYDGGADTAAVIDDVCAGPPLLTTVAEDGLTQRVWAVTDPDLQDRVARDLAGRQALIADGHHRWATYRRLQAERRAQGRGAGPWDHGLAMLVDSRAYPLRVAAIHRVVRRLSLGDALAAAADAYGVQRDAGPDLAAAMATLQGSTAGNPVVVTDGRRYHLLAHPDEAALERALPPERSPLWRSLDASVLHHLLIEQVWGVPERDVTYVHDPAAAARAAAKAGGVAVLLRPVPVANVLALAADGERMPRKSTSFGPKPRNGLVLRLLDD
jgi:uncharacterized protein (DUF1015 family)